MPQKALVLGTLTVLGLALPVLLAGEVRTGRSEDAELDRRIGAWEKTVAEFEAKARALAGLYSSPGEGADAKEGIASTAARDRLVTIIQTAKARGSFSDKEEQEEAETIAGRLEVQLTRMEVRPVGSGLICFVVAPSGGTKVLPSAPFIPDDIPGEIKVAATPGEFEPASFVLYSKTDLTDLTLQATDLKGRGGTIPSSSVDLKVVKCWYQAGIIWETGSHWEKKFKDLVPELLLNDETLVKVDAEKRENYLRLSFPEGEKYVWISDPDEVFKTWLTVDEFPVKDSPVLLPVTIPARTNKQFWVTVKVPQDAEDGIYTGSIGLRSKGQVLETLPLRLRVLPFSLASPRTSYDLRREFVSSIYYLGRLVAGGKKGTIYTILKNEEQLRAELRNMVDHGVTNPIVTQGWEDLELLRKFMVIRDEAGMGSRVLYTRILDMAGFLGCNFTTGEGLPVVPEKLAALKVRVREMIDFFRSHGITDVYFYGQDEGKDEQLKAQLPVWEAVREAGGKVFVAGYSRAMRRIVGNREGNFELVGDALDLFISCAFHAPDTQPKKGEADKWHSVGNRIWVYANPQSAPENPALFRKGYGFVPWKAEYDGDATWAYIHYYPPWNDFRKNGKLYNFVYPTVNGVVDTIAWEGYREAIDDIRYATTLKLLIEEKRGGPKAAVALEAEHYLEDLDPVTGPPPGAIRSEIVGYILRLL